MPTVQGSSGLFSSSVDLHYEDTGGDGRPVVLIHGWPLSGKAWAGQVAPLTEAGYRVVTYDRRGFGESGKPGKGHDYDTFADDLAAVLDELDLRDATLVGFSMGGGEVARYVAKHGQDRLHSLVFAAAVPPMLLKTDDNPEGGLADADVEGMKEGWKSGREEFLDQFMTGFFSVGDDLKVSEAQRQEALGLAAQAEDQAALDCIDAFSRTDFREDIAQIRVPTLVIHGDSDAIVPIEVSGNRTANGIAGSELRVVSGAPHGLTVSHADEFNDALLGFLAR